jgi:MFS family permease
VLALVALANLAAGPVLVLLPVIAKDVLKGGPQTLGFLTAASALGGIAAGLYLAGRKKMRGLEVLLVWGIGMLGVILDLFSYSDRTVFSVLLMALGGGAFLIVMSGSNVFLQVTVMENQRGRVLGFFTMAMRGTMPLASLAAGALAGRWGAVQAVRWSGILGLAAAVFFFPGRDKMRQAINDSEDGRSPC